MASQPSSSPSSTIVLMHGLLGNAKNFQTLVKLLLRIRGEIDIVVLDLRSWKDLVLGDLSWTMRAWGKMYSIHAAIESGKGPSHWTQYGR